MTKTPKPADLTTEQRTWAWGQILKDAETFEGHAAVDAISVLAYLGYDGTDPFMCDFWGVLCSKATPVVKMVYIVHLAGGTHSLYNAATKEAAFDAARHDVGADNINSIRPALTAEIDWHAAMGGSITQVVSV